MIDEEAITIATKIARRNGATIVHLEPTGCIDEIVSVDFLSGAPIVSRRPSRDKYPKLWAQAGESLT